MADPVVASDSVSSLGSEVLAGLLGAGIAVGCLLPPLLHLVTGPLGPFIGGFVAANRVGGALRSRIVVAATLATTAAGFVGGILSIADHFATAGELPGWFPATGAGVGLAMGIVWVYCAGLATVGASVRAASDSKRPPST